MNRTGFVLRSEGGDYSRRGLIGVEVSRSSSSGQESQEELKLRGESKRERRLDSRLGPP